VIALQVNGKRVELDGPTVLTEYLERLGADPRAIAVEHNGEIVERAAYAKLVLRDGDHVEIVRMVGGGLVDRESVPDRGLGLGPFVPGL